MKKLIHTGILCALVLFIAGCATDNTPKPTPLSKNAPSVIAVKMIWERNLTEGNDGKNLTLGSVLQGETLVGVGYNGEVIAVNVQNGRTLWQKNISEHISATPGTNSNTVFVGTREGNLYALDLTTGQIKWHVPMSTLILGAPSASEDTVVVQCHDSVIEAFTTENGTKLWAYQATAPMLTLYSNSSPFIDSSNKVYVGFDNGQLGAFDLYQGIELWQVPIAIPESTEIVQNMVDIDGTPVLDSGVLFTTSYHGTLSAVNLSNGQVIWQRANSSFEAPVVQAGKVITVDETGRVQAFDESTGATLWQQKDLRYRFVSSPQVLNNAVIVGDYQGFVHFLSLADGSLLARIKVSGAGINAAPIIDNNRVIVTANDGRVVVLEPSAS